MIYRLFFIVYILCDVYHATDLPPRLETYVDKATLSSNETVKFSIKLIKDASQDLEIPELGDLIQGFRIIDYGLKELEEDDRYPSMKIYEKWYNLTADLSGEYILPAVVITYKTSEGLEEELSTSEIFIRVNSSKDQGVLEKDIRDIKNIFEEKMSFFFIFILLGLLSGVIIIILIVKMIAKRTRKRPLVIKPWEKAVEALNEIKVFNLDDPSLVKKYYFTLTDILKLYFEEEFFYPATDRTYPELVRDLKQMDKPSKEFQKKFLEIIEHVELIKYSDLVKDHKFHEEIWKRSLHFIEITKPLVIEHIEDEDALI